MTDASSGWVATHRSPRQGMDAWAAPDPGATPSSALEGHVEVQVTETAGEWARVRGENGWDGWVDGRLLEQLDPSGAPGDERAYILLTIAVVVLIVIAVVGWTS